ncbi:S-layer protein [Natronobacterium lacisalsi]|uniref:S-layer protein n=1 Tax=Natronobacterium lacisalsi TaxID=229731 RepID=UPI001EE765A0|nr:S-layer protein [Halobiforma lacisalsi]
MSRRSLSRRRFGAGLTALAAVGLAGCTGDEEQEESDDSADFELDDPGDLTIRLENEDGDPVSSGVAVTIENEEEDFTANYQNNIQDGEITGASLIYEGEYTITVESVDDEFETVEESVTLEEDEDETVTIVLEGATGDSDAE